MKKALKLVFWIFFAARYNLFGEFRKDPNVDDYTRWCKDLSSGWSMLLGIVLTWATFENLWMTAGTTFAITIAFIMYICVGFVASRKGFFPL